MFWRLIEWGFLISAAVLGGRFVYILWTGKPKYVAEKDLADAQEKAVVADIEKVASTLRQRSQPKEQKDAHVPRSGKRPV